MKKRILYFIIALAFVFSLGLKSFADFGDFAGDDDFGGYDNDYSYDYDDDDDYDYDYDDDDDDYYYDDDDNGRYSGSTSVHYYYKFDEAPEGSFDGAGLSYNSDFDIIAVGALLMATDSEISDSGSDAVLTVMGIGIVAIIILTVSRKNRTVKKPSYNKKATVAPGAKPTDVSTLTPMREYTKLDPGFSEVELKEKLSNIYVRMQNAWTGKNMESLRPYFTDMLYAQYDSQLENYRKNKTTNYIEKIAVLDVTLSGYKQEGGNDIIVARLYTRFTDYTLNDTTGVLVRGDQKAEKFMNYEWTLTRKSGVTTTSGAGTRVINCPNCGAPVDINKSARCEYCDSIITVDSSDWVINGIKAISQRTSR